MGIPDRRGLEHISYLRYPPLQMGMPILDGHCPSEGIKIIVAIVRSRNPCYSHADLAPEELVHMPSLGVHYVEHKEVRHI